MSFVAFEDIGEEEFPPAPKSTTRPVVVRETERVMNIETAILDYLCQTLAQ